MLYSSSLSPELKSNTFTDHTLFEFSSNAQRETGFEKSYTYIQYARTPIIRMNNFPKIP